MAKTKRLNRRAVLAISVFGVIVVGGLGLAYVLTLPKNPDFYIQEAEKSLQKASPDYEAALRNFDRAINAASKTQGKVPADYYCRKAEVALEWMNKDPNLSSLRRRDLFSKAFEALRDQAVIRDPSHVKSHRILVELMYQIALSDPDNQKNWNEYVGELGEILSLEPNDAATFHRRGRAYVHLMGTDSKQFRPKALADLSQAVKLDPANLTYWQSLTDFLAMTGEVAKAEQAFKEEIAANPKKAEARTSYAIFLRRQKRNSEAEKLVQEAIQCEPDNPVGDIFLAQECLQARQPEKAKAALDAALRIDKSDIRTYGLLAELYRQQNDFPTAAKALREGLDAIRQEQAKTEDKVRERVLLYNSAFLNHLLAQILLDINATSQDEKVRQKALEEAKECQQVLETTLSPNDPRRFQIAGRIAMVEKNWPEARTALERVLAVTFDFNTVNRLVMVYRQLGMPGQSEKLLQEILQRPGLPPEAASHFLALLASLRQEAQDYKQALAYSEQALRLDPKNELAQKVQRVVQVYQAKQEDLPEAKKIDSVARVALVQRARDFLLEEQLDQAEPILERLIERDPKDLQALSMMVQMLVQTQQEDKAIQYVDRALKADPKNEDLKRLDVLLKESDPSKRYRIEMEFVDRAVSDPLERAIQKWSIAGRYGKTKESESFLEEAEKADPRNSAVIEIRFRQAMSKKDWKAAEELIRRLEEKNAGEDVREFYQARFKMAQEDFAAAIPLLTSFLQKAPHGWQQRLMLAECYRRTGKLDEARKEMRTCYEDNPKNLYAIVALAQLAQQRGRMDEHAMWIEEAYRTPAGRLDPYVHEQHLQGMETDPENLQTAIREREQILEKTPGNLENAFRLARLYERNGQLDRAQDMIEYVFQRTPNKLAMAPLLAELYREMKRSSKADDLFNDLLKQAKTQEEKSAVHLAYANFLSAFDESAAIRIYEKAIEEEGESGVQALRAMGDFFAVQARRLADEGKRTESLEKWRESVDWLKKVVAKKPDDRALQLVLLRRYVEAGMFDQAIEGYQNCIQKDSSDVDAQIGLGLAYLQSDRLDDAEKQFDDIIQSHPDSSDAYMFRAQVYQARANLLKAAEDVRKASTLSGNLVQIMDLARLYEAMDDVGKAIDTYNSMITENPDFFPAYRNLLDLLIRQKRWVELDRSAQAGMTKFPQSPYFPIILAQAAKDQGQTDNELRWLQEALRVVPDDAAVVRQYFQALLDAKEYARLQREAQKYINRPPHDVAVAAILLAAEAKKSPQADKPFQQFLALLRTAKQSADVFFVGQMMQKAYGAQKLAESASDIIGARPEDWQAYVIVGGAVQETGDFARAEQNYLKAEQLCKSPAERYQVDVRLAQVYERMGDFAKVEKTYQEVLKNNPNNILALNNLAYAYADKLNRPEEALTLVRRAMKLTPGDPNLVDTYAWALAKLGRYQEAVDNFQKVLARSSASADSLFHMGYCLENTGDLSGAQGFYRRALSSAQSQKNANLVKLLEEAKARVEQKLSKE